MTVGGKVDLPGVKWTLLVALYLRAVESRSKGSARDTVRLFRFEF